MSTQPLTKLLAVLLAAGFVAAACSSSSSEGESLPPLGSDATDPTTPTTTSTTTTADTTPEPITSDPADLRTLWNQMWVATGLEETEREAAVAEIADSINPDIAVQLPDVMQVPEEREVLTDPAFTTNSDGSINIRDCVLYSPPYRSLDASHIHEGKAVPDGDGGWIIEQAQVVGQGCVPAAMADKILEDYAAYIQAFVDATNPPDPNHPSLAETMTGDYLENIANGVQVMSENDRYYVDADIRNPEISKIPASNVIRIRDCVELSPDSGIFEADGTLLGGFDPPEAGERSTFIVTMRLEGGRWKTENVEINSQSACEVAPTPAGLQVV